VGVAKTGGSVKTHPDLDEVLTVKDIELTAGEEWEAAID
jgi:hypothetical protein